MRAVQETAIAGLAAARYRRWWVLVAAVGVPLLLVGAGVIAYTSGIFNDHGKFRTEPAACATVTPFIDLLGTSYTTRQDESNNCHLMLPRDNPSYIDAPKISISYYVASPRRENAPDAASKLLRQLGTTETGSLPGVGDEAYPRDRSIFLRVSNLVVAILVFVPPVSSADQVRAFAVALANRLRSGGR